MGKTVFEPKTPPSETGAFVWYHASANAIGNMIINQAANANYWVSNDQAVTWNQLAHGGRVFRSTSRPLRFDLPGAFDEIPGVPILELQPNFVLIGDRLAASSFRRVVETDILGKNPRVAYEQNTGGFLGQGYTSGNWTPDGRYYAIGGGDAQTPGTIPFIAGSDLTAPLSALSLSVPLGGSNIHHLIGIVDEDSHTEALFIMAVATTDFRIVKLRLRHGQWSFKTIANPLVRQINYLCQRGPIIIGGGGGGGTVNQIIRSTDYGETFSIVAVPSVGDTNVVWDNYGKFYAGCTGASKLIESSKGTIWTASTNQPSMNKRIDAACNALEASYIFSGDAINTHQCYRIRRPGEI